MANYTQYLLGFINPLAAAGLTRLNPATLISQAEGRRQLAPNTLSRIESVYKSVTFDYLRKAGFGERAAKELSGSAPWTITKKAEQLAQSINNISEVYGVSPDIISRNMGVSEKPADELIQYGSEWRIDITDDDIPF